MNALLNNDGSQQTTVIEHTPSIASSAMLVEINRRKWNGYAVNHDATEKVRQDYGTGRRAARVNQPLLINEPLFDQVNTLYSALGAELYHFTMPWLDRGPRLLTTPVFFDFNKSITGIINTIENEAKPAFFDEYPNMILRAGNSDRLGALFNPDHYPDVDTLRTYYEITLRYSPVPDAGDFRVDIGREAMAMVRDSYEKSYQSQLQSAYKDVWDRTYKALKAMSEKLEGEKKQGRFHESLVSNITDMVDLLDRFNVTNDPNMARAKIQIAQAMRGVTIDGLKEDDGFRLETKAKVDSLLKSFEW